jgi:hypothetical protein
MSFLRFRKSEAAVYLIPLLLLFLILNIFSSSAAPQNQQKKADEQNIALLDASSSTNILFDINTPEKRGFERISGISDVRNYYNSSVNVIFKIYPALIKNNLCNSNSSRTFIISFFSTDI